MKTPNQLDWPTTLPAKVALTARPGAGGPVLLVCEHASRAIPAGLARLGINEDAAESHIAWDPGALAVAEKLSKALDATLVSQKISRLVYDCNRPPESADAVRDKSEIYAIPGNAGLTKAQRAARATYIYHPFRQEVARLVSERPELALVTIHSFSPVYFGVPREVEIGFLHDSDSRLADAMLDEASKLPTFHAKRNAPYGPEDGVTHTLLEHAVPRGMQNVMIEVRNDLISDEIGANKVAQWLGAILISALNSLGEEG